MNQPYADKYVCINLAAYWEDSTVNQVYISESIVTHLTETYIQLKNNSIDHDVEHGAFLLGNYQLYNNSFNITIDHFIQINAKEQSISNIEFGPKSWSELDEALDKFPQSKIVGWFHTHPGHGIFLSDQDVNVSYTFFNKPYQIALLLDNHFSMRKKQLELGIFSFKKTGEINNC